MRYGPFLAALMICAGRIHAAAEEFELPADLTTADDGRATIHELFSSYGRLLEMGWTLDVITYSQPADTRHALPVIALRSASSGPALWIFSGIHGEEPAGPNAIAALIEDIAAVGQRHPVVLMPLANPHGYVRNWRYLNTPIWSDDVEVQSVGDSSHMLPSPDNPGRPRATAASSPEADAITRYIVDTMTLYPPLISVDLHEDDIINEGYIYSQGVRGAMDPLATEAVRTLLENSIPIKLDGYTRFDEKIVAGIIGPVTDSSIDELMSAQQIIVDGARHDGPAARSVLVFETPAGNLPLEYRIRAHEALLRRIMLHVADGEI